MLSSVAAGAGVLLAGAVIAVVLLAGVAFAGVWWLRRRAGHRLQALGLVLAGRGRRGAAGAASAGARWLWSRPLPHRRWISAGRARWQLWRAVSAAGHAVGVARDGGAPVGDLDALCGRLRQAAGDAGRSLTIAGRATAAGSELRPASSQVTGLISAAGQIQGAAAAALAWTSRPAVSSLADDVRREEAALAAGMASAAGPSGPREARGVSLPEVT